MTGCVEELLTSVLTPPCNYPFISTFLPSYYIHLELCNTHHDLHDVWGLQTAEILRFFVMYIAGVLHSQNDLIAIFHCSTQEAFGPHLTMHLPNWLIRPQLTGKLLLHDSHLTISTMQLWSLEPDITGLNELLHNSNDQGIQWSHYEENNM